MREPLRDSLARFFLNHFLECEAAAVEFGLNGGETGEGWFAQAVPLDLAGDGGGRLFYGGHCALEREQVFLFHRRDTT